MNILCDNWRTIVSRIFPKINFPKDLSTYPLFLLHPITILDFLYFIMKSISIIEHPFNFENVNDKFSKFVEINKKIISQQIIIYDSSTFSLFIIIIISILTWEIISKVFNRSTSLPIVENLLESRIQPSLSNHQNLAYWTSVVDLVDCCRADWHPRFTWNPVKECRDTKPSSHE